MGEAAFTHLRNCYRKNKQYVNQSHHVSQRVFTKYRQAMTENEISKIILDCAFKVHTKLGSRLLEKVYR